MKNLASSRNCDITHAAYRKVQAEWSINLDWNRLDSQCICILSHISQIILYFWSYARMVAKIKRTLCIEYMFKEELRKIYVHAFCTAISCSVCSKMHF